MFYSHELLSKKGSLGSIWIAGTLGTGQMKKRLVLSINLAQTCDDIESPHAPLSLRLSGILLCGTARIIDKKSRFLQAEANEFLKKVKGSFRHKVVDLPQAKRTARSDHITMDLAAVPLHVSGYLWNMTPVSGEENLEGVDVEENHLVPIPSIGQYQAPAHELMLDSDMPISSEMPIPNEDEFLFSNIEGADMLLEQFLGDPLFSENMAIDTDFGQGDPQAFEQQGQDGQLPSETGSFLGGPLDGSIPTPTVKKRQKRLRIDTETELSSDTIRSNLADPSDTMMERPYKSVRGSSDAPHSRQLWLLEKEASPELQDILQKWMTGQRTIVLERNTIETQALASAWDEAPLYDDPPLEAFEQPVVGPEEPEVARTVFGRRVSEAERASFDASRNKDSSIGSPYVSTDEEGKSPKRTRFSTLSGAGIPEEINLDDINVDVIPEEQTEEPNTTPSMEEASASASRHADQNTREAMQAAMDIYTTRMLNYFREQMVEDAPLDFNTLVEGSKKKSIARIFYQMLVLKSNQYIDLEQKQPFGSIQITKGRDFYLV